MIAANRAHNGVARRLVRKVSILLGLIMWLADCSDTERSVLGYRTESNDLVVVRSGELLTG